MFDAFQQIKKIYELATGTQIEMVGPLVCGDIAAPLNSATAVPWSRTSGRNPARPTIAKNLDVSIRHTELEVIKEQ